MTPRFCSATIEIGEKSAAGASAALFSLLDANRPMNACEFQWGYLLNLAKAPEVASGRGIHRSDMFRICEIGPKVLF